MPDLPKSVIGRMKAQAAPNEHPDPDLLAAFSEQALTGREREHVLAHLAACAACREAVALAAPQPAALQPGGVFVPWYRRPQIFAWAGSLATLALVGALILNYSQSRYSPATLTDATPPKVARTQPAENKPAAPPANGALNGSLGALKADASRQAASLAKAEPEQKKKAEEDRDRRDMAGVPSPAAAPAAKQSPGKDQKTLDGGMLASQYSVRNEAAPAPAATPPARAAHTVSDEVQRSTLAEAAAVQSAAPPTKSAGASGAAVGGLVYQSRTKMAAAPVVRWSISEKGKLQRSSDGGRTWQPALANEATVFRALAVVGNDVWVGGGAATLFHSSDGGATWAKQTLPGASADISSLQFSDSQHGSAHTADGGAWATSDGGLHWNKQ